MKAHDVRRLKVCDGCDGIGMLRPLLNEPWPLLMRTPSGRTLHATCMSEPLLLKCADVELVYVRISDVGPTIFSHIVDELERRRAAENPHV